MDKKTKRAFKTFFSYYAESIVTGFCVALVFLIIDSTGTTVSLFIAPMPSEQIIWKTIGIEIFKVLLALLVASFGSAMILKNAGKKSHADAFASLIPKITAATFIIAGVMVLYILIRFALFVISVR